MLNNKKNKNTTKPDVQIQGWPGYRTRDNRTGYDPIDTRAETGHMTGVFIRSLFTLGFRSHNPVHLLLLFFLGVVPFLFSCIFFFGVIFSEGFRNVLGLCHLLILLIVSGLLTANFVLSILKILGVVSPNRKKKKRNKKKQTRRKKQITPL